MPHGAPAVRKDKDDNRHFVVWNTYQLHGDVGERMGLTRKVSTVTWKNLRDRSHPNERIKDAKGKTIQYWCLGDIYPNDYGIPGDWDVLGNLPPRKRQKLEEAMARTPKSNPPLAKTATTLPKDTAATSLPATQPFPTPPPSSSRPATPNPVPAPALIKL